MNILVLPSWYKTQDSPLLGSFFREQAVALAALGHDVSLLYVYADARYEKYYEEFNDEGVRTYFVHFKKSKWRLNRLIMFFETLTAYRKIHKRVVPDIIHVHSFHHTKYAKIISVLYRVPYVVTEHSSAFARHQLTSYQKFIVRMGFNGARKVIAVSDGLKGRLEKYCRKEIVVVPNMVSKDFFTMPINKSSDTRDTPVTFRFLSVGYLDEIKGMDMLIRAFANILKDNLVAELIIGGDGAKYVELTNLAQSLGVSSQVHFLGNLTRQEVKREMENCHSFVLASRFETFGIVLIEALASGKPIIMTETDAARTIVTNGNGFSIPIDNVEALTYSMIRMITEYERFNPVLIAKDCYEKFSEEAVGKQITAVYKDVLENDAII